MELDSPKMLPLQVYTFATMSGGYGGRVCHCVLAGYYALCNEYLCSCDMYLFSCISCPGPTRELLMLLHFPLSYYYCIICSRNDGFSCGHCVDHFRHRYLTPHPTRYPTPHLTRYPTGHLLLRFHLHYCLRPSLL